jgi:hypothetical protein
MSKTMMMTTLAIIVHSRIDNLKHWLHCLSLCPPVEVVIIHNDNGEDWSELCKDHTYIKRPNIGFDIGAMKWAFENLHFDKLLWCCDDTLPMSTDFVQQYESAHTTGVVCMDLSPYIRAHIRTTGFMIDKDTALKVQIPQITTKEDCYQFEHRDSANHFLAQVTKMGRPVKQLAPRDKSPLYDVGYHRRLDRFDEHAAVFGPYIKPEEIEQKEITTIICPIYRTFPAIVSCLIMQTNTNWRLWLIHDGPVIDPHIEDYINLVNDDRITFEATPERKGNWGHEIRRDYLQRVTSKYVIITSPDNYYAPKFIELALTAIVRKTRHVAAFSELMAHNYAHYKILKCRMDRGYIDCGGILLKTSKAKDPGYENITDHSADWLWFKGLIAKHGVNNFVPFSGCHYIHN